MNAYLKQWKWFLLSFCLLLGAGYVYLLMAQPVYSVQASIMIRNEQKGDADERVLKELDFFEPKRLIDNEVKMLQSVNLMRRVVDKLSLATRYYRKTTFVKRELYNESPVQIMLDEPAENLYNSVLHAEVIDLKTVRLNGRMYPANQRVTTPYGQLRLIIREQYTQLDNQAVEVRIMDSYNAARYYLNNLKVIPSGKTMSVIEFSLEDPVPVRGKDLLEQLIREYNVVSVEDKNQTVASTLSFIKNRLALVAGEVKAVEKSIEQYKSANAITDISTDVRTLLEQVQKNDDELNRTAIQLSALADAETYLRNQTPDQRGAVPVTLGLGDPTLVALFSRLTELELQRENLRLTASEASPLLGALDNQIATARKTVTEAIASHKKNLTNTDSQLRANNARYAHLVRSVPSKERTLMNITRQQAIKNNLYTYLLQKQEEVGLAYASVNAGIRIVDSPYSIPAPVKPNRPLILLLFGSLGLFIPAGVITVRSKLNERVVGRQDIDESLQVPIIGELIQTKYKHPNIISGTKRSIAAEQIRALRTKLQTLRKEQDSSVLLITSGISGEGKSFLGLNLSASFALVNQPTVLLEMDFRKPDLHTYLAPPNTLGLSNYLNGQVELDEIVRPVGGSLNHFFISCGTVLLNPAELLTDPRLEQLFDDLRRRFTYILVDAPPIGLVTDAEIMAPFTDLTLYVIRYNVTPKGSLREIDCLYKEQRLPRLSLVLNSATTFHAYSQHYYNPN